MRLDVQGLVKRYNSHFALTIPTLHIASGQTFGLVGNNGAGKTTFLRLILDLLDADEGRIELDGLPVAETDTWKPSVGSYLDTSFLMDFLTPEEYFTFVGSVYGHAKKEVDERLHPYAPFLGDAILRESKYLRDLSMGSAKKVGIAAAILIRPQLLILDEPFANLDPRSQIRLKDILRTLNRDHGTTLFVSSHDLAHVTDVCEHIAILEDGRIVREIQTSDGTLRELEQYFAAELKRV